MIVISGALVLVAAVLLVVGIISSISLVYAAIGLSLVSAVFLLVGVFQRPLPVPERTRSDDGESIPSPPVRVSKVKEPVRVSEDVSEPTAEYEDSFAVLDAAAEYPLEAADPDLESRAEATGAEVLVISGRPRYHVGGCEYVEGHEESEPLDIVEARELGFTPCGVCRPNQTLALQDAGREETVAPHAAAKVSTAAAQEASGSVITAPIKIGAPAGPAETNGSRAASNGSRSAAPATEPSTSAAPVREPVVAPAAAKVTSPPAEPVSDEGDSASEPATPAQAARAPRKRTSKASGTQAKKVATETAPQDDAKEAAAQAAPETAVPESGAAKPATTVPESTPPSQSATATRPRVATRSVQGVAVTKEYHRSGCVLLDGVEAEELSKAAAIRKGYQSCGVCKP